MAISETSICNSALVKVGTKRITSIDEPTKQARICKEQYPKIRDEVTESHPWIHAIRRAGPLSPEAEAPIQVNDDYTQQFVLPSDCLRVLSIDADKTEQDWAVEGGKLLTTASTVKIKYIGRESDVSKYSATFADVVAWRLAVELAYVLIENSALAERMFLAYSNQLSLARNFNSMVGSVTRVKANTFLRARRGSRRINS